MSYIAINTLEYAKKFKECGFPQNQAEGLANALFEVMEDHGSDHARKNDLDNFATKSDIEALALATKNDIEALALATKNDINALASATKNDINALASSTKNDIQALASSTKNDIQALAADMQKMEHQILVKLGTLMVSLFAVFSVVPQFFG